MMPSLSSGLSFLTSASSFTDKAAKLFTNISSTFDVERRAIVRRVIKGHQFEATVLGEPTKCSHCNQHIWIPHGQKCKLCKLSSHSRCLNQIRTRCVKSATDLSLEPRVLDSNRACHEFHQIISITKMCDHCGTCILTIKCDECSLCSRTYHSDCLEFVPGECDLGRRTSCSSQHDDIAQSYEHTSKLSIEHFDILAEVGKGSFSTVYLARLKHARQGKRVTKYAIKVINKTNTVIIADPKSAFTEWRALNLGHSYPFLTQGYCCFQSRDRLFFVMEYVQGRDLIYFLDNERGAFSEERARFYAAEIVLALLFLHQRHNIVYRDLKLNNVLLDPFGHCKLIDFGMAKILDANRMKTSTFCGTPYYMSPEILSGQAYDFSVDWWSLGVLIYEMLCDAQPFSGDDNERIYEAIRTQELSYPINIKLSDRARSLLDGLLTKDPRHRLGCQLLEGCAEAIKSHPFFLFKINNNNDEDELHHWAELEAKQIKPPYIPAKTDEQKCFKLPRFDSISEKQLREVRQEDFDNFSNYCESFLDELNA